MSTSTRITRSQGKSLSAPQPASVLPTIKKRTTLKKPEEIPTTQTPTSRRYSVRVSSRPVAASRLSVVKAAPVSNDGMEPAPFHRGGLKLITQTLLTDPSLDRRGLNRNVRIGFRYGVRGKNDKQRLLIRFSKYPTKVDPAAECHPLNLAVNLNGVDIVKPAVVDFSRKYRPYYSPIEVELKNGMQDNNTLSISWTAEEKVALEQDFRLLIEVAERKTMAEMLKEIKKDAISVTTAKLFRELTNQEHGIEQTSRSVSLRCCLNRTRVKLPVRGKNCTHLECYDATAYLQLNQTSRATWLCPECNKSVPFKDLVVDKFMVDLLHFSENSLLKLTVENNQVIVREIKKNAPIEVHDVDLDQSIILL